MLGNSDNPQVLPVIDNAFHDEVLRGLETRLGADARPLAVVPFQ
jgi:hypothetical protein